MARNRMIQSSFWADEKVGKLSARGRLLFIGLWTYAEDQGVGRANPIYLKNSIFPYDSIGAKQIDEILQQLKENGMIDLYEVDQQQYYYVCNFHKHQSISHASAAKLPPYPGTKQTLQEDSGSTPGALQEDSIPKEEKEKENNINQKKREKKETYGSLKNVFLSCKEYKDLCSRIGRERLEQLIETMSLYQKTNEKSYADHYGALLLWNNREKDVPEGHSKQELSEWGQDELATLHGEETL